jgi:hypothetical protein
MALLVGLSGSALAAPAKAKLAAKPAATSKPKDDRPAGTVGSGAMTMEQMKSGLQYLVAQKYGISINYVLPKTWEVVTKEMPGSGKTPGVFVTSSRKKMPDPNDPTDFIYELSIFEPDITKGMDPKAKDFDDKLGKAFKEFLDVQLGVNIKAKNKVVSRAGDIVPKKYGPQPDKNGMSTRPQTTFVPIHYEVPPPKGKGNAAELYTFTGLTGGHIWQLKFLVNQDMIQVYEPLIALIVNNTFALTDAQQAKLEQNTRAIEQKAAAASKSNSKSNKSKGK